MPRSMSMCVVRVCKPVELLKCVFFFSLLMFVLLLYETELIFKEEYMQRVKLSKGTYHFPQNRIILDLSPNRSFEIYGDTEFNTWSVQLDSPSEKNKKDGNISFVNQEVNKVPLEIPVNTPSSVTKLGSPEKDALDLASLVTQISRKQRSRTESLTKRLQYFKTLMTVHEKNVLLDIAQKLDDIANQWNITYFLYGGALLGSYRHHDIIPWDDDLDVFVNYKDRDKLFHVINASSDYNVFIAGPRMKMWSNDSERKSKYPWGWPYVDISLYYENDTHIWDTAEEYSDYVYPKSIVFPLHKRPLAGFSFNAPRDSFANIKLTYKSSDCVTHHYSHKYEKIHKSKRKVVVPCDVMYNNIPFVHRTKSDHGIKETLILGNSVIHSMIVDEPSYAVSETYKLKLVQMSNS